MNTRIVLPKFDPAKIRSGVKPERVEQTQKDKLKHQRRPKHRKAWQQTLE
jgi:hypothetical protein